MFRQPSHWILLALVVLILFGAPKLPDFARSLGKSLNILKEETQNLRGDTKQDTAASAEDTKPAAAEDTKPAKEARDD